MGLWSYFQRKTQRFQVAYQVIGNDFFGYPQPGGRDRKNVQVLVRKIHFSAPKFPMPIAVPEGAQDGIGVEEEGREKRLGCLFLPCPPICLVMPQGIPVGLVWFGCGCALSLRAAGLMGADTVCDNHG